MNTRKTAMDIIRQISHEVEDRRVPLEIMLREIQMMKFKVRPLLGDINEIDTSHYEFVRALWRIGKVEEILNDSFGDLDEDDQEALIAHLDALEDTAQSSIRHAMKLQKQDSKNEHRVRLEVFRDTTPRSAIN